MRIVGILISIMLAWSLPWPSAAQDPNAAANRLFVQAQKLLQEPASANSEDRLKNLRQARSLADRIVEEYPASNLAVQLISGQPIGTFWLKAIDEEISKTIVAIRTERARKEEPKCIENPNEVCIAVQILALAHKQDSLMSRAETMRTVAEVQARSRDRTGALETIDQIRDMAGRAEKGYEKTIVNASRMRAQIALGQVREVLQEVEAIADKGQARDARFYAVVALTKHGRRDAALQVSETFDNVDYRVFALLFIADDDRKNGRRQQALALVGQARRATESLVDPSERSTALAMIGVVETRLELPGGQEAFAGAISAMRMIEDDSKRIRSLENAVRQLTRAKRFDEAVALAREIQGPEERANMLIFIASWQEAPAEISRSLLDDAFSLTTSIPDKFRKERVIEAIAVGRASKGQMDKATEMIKLISLDITRHFTQAAIARALSKAGQVAEAIKYADAIGNSSRRDAAIASIAGDMTRSQGLKPAYALLLTVKDPSAKVEGLHNMIKGQD